MTKLIITAYITKSATKTQTFSIESFASKTYPEFSS